MIAYIIKVTQIQTEQSDNSDKSEAKIPDIYIVSLSKYDPHATVSRQSQLLIILHVACFLTWML